MAGAFCRVTSREDLPKSRSKKKPKNARSSEPDYIPLFGGESFRSEASEQKMRSKMENWQKTLVSDVPNKPQT